MIWQFRKQIPRDAQLLSTMRRETLFRHPLPEVLNLNTPPSNSIASLMVSAADVLVLVEKINGCIDFMHMDV